MYQSVIMHILKSIDNSYPLVLSRPFLQGGRSDFIDIIPAFTFPSFVQMVGVDRDIVTIITVY